MPEPKKRAFLECENTLAEDVKIFCFLKRISVKSFVTNTLKEKLEPYKEWVRLVREIP